MSPPPVSPEPNRPARIDVTRRLAGFLLLSAGLPAAVRLEAVARLVGTPYVGPVSLHVLALPPRQEHLLLLLLLFSLWLVSTTRRPVGRVPARQRAAALTAYLAAAVLSVVVTHLPAPVVDAARAADGAHEWTGLASTLALYGGMLLPVPAAFALFFPTDVIRRGVRPMGVGVALGLGFLVIGELAAAFHPVLARPALGLATWLLRPFGEVTVADGGDVPELLFRGFRVRFGPQCVALDGVILFALLAAAICRYEAGRRRVRVTRAALAVAAGAVLLFLLNGARLAVIMALGVAYPEVAVDLFHGVAGTAILGVLLLAFDRWVVPGLVGEPSWEGYSRGAAGRRKPSAAPGARRPVRRMRAPGRRE